MLKTDTFSNIKFSDYHVDKMHNNFVNNKRTNDINR